MKLIFKVPMCLRENDESLAFHIYLNVNGCYRTEFITDIFPVSNINEVIIYWAHDQFLTCILNSSVIFTKLCGAVLCCVALNKFPTLESKMLQQSEKCWTINYYRVQLTELLLYARKWSRNMIREIKEIKKNNTTLRT